MKKHVLDRLWIHLIVVIASGLLYVSCQKEENHILPEEESTSSEINRQAAPDDEDVDINELVEWVSNTPIEPQDIDNIFG